MHFSVYRQSQLLRRKSRMLLLALFWLAGLSFGIYAAASSGDSLFPLMRTVVQSRVSIVGLVVILVLPFLFSGFAVFSSQPWLLLILCFAKAFSFSFCAYLSQLCFGSAGWLVRLLLLFSDGCTLPVLCWFWVRHISGEMGAVGTDLAVCTAFTFFIGSIDYCLISPFLATLIDF